MKNLTLLLLIIFAIAFPLTGTAQLSDYAIDQVADKHVEKWAQYFSLSNYRKSELKKSWKKHEHSKSKIFLSTSNIKNRLQEENTNYRTALTRIFTPNELKAYYQLEALKFEDDKAYLASLVKAISTDTIFVNAYSHLQYNKILPFKMAVRMDLENVISTEDKLVLDTVRTEVLNLYDKCLVTCILGDHGQENMYEDFDNSLIVALNKNLSNSESAISKLVRLTKKYEEEIHNVYINHKSKFDHWEEEKKSLKEQYILDSYNKSLQELRKRDGLTSLKHLESEATFLLLTPFDYNLSRKLFNLDVYNGL